MKFRILTTIVLTAWLVVSACSWTVVDPRSPADATATNAAMLATATATAEVAATAVVIATEEAPQVDCNIKANVSGKDKIYHLPGGVYYDRIKIDLTQGDFYACSEDEAISKGFRKSSR